VEKEKLRNGNGGVWRIPPSFDGCKRSPLPRFTVLTEGDRSKLQSFFSEFARRALRVLVPGGHLFIATNPLLSHLVYAPLRAVASSQGLDEPDDLAALFEARLDHTRPSRGPPRPSPALLKNAHGEFAHVTESIQIS